MAQRLDFAYADASQAQALHPIILTGSAGGGGTGEPRQNTEEAGVFISRAALEGMQSGAGAQRTLKALPPTQGAALAAKAVAAAVLSVRARQISTYVFRMTPVDRALALPVPAGLALGGGTQPNQASSYAQAAAGAASPLSALPRLPSASPMPASLSSSSSSSSSQSSSELFAQQLVVNAGPLYALHASREAAGSDAASDPLALAPHKALVGTLVFRPVHSHENKLSARPGDFTAASATKGGLLAWLFRDSWSAVLTLAAALLALVALRACARAQCPRTRVAAALGASCTCCDECVEEASHPQDAASPRTVSKLRTAPVGAVEGGKRR